MFVTLWIFFIIIENPEELQFPINFNSSAGVILGGVLFFVLGELVNQLRLFFHPVPFPFMRLIAEQTGNDDYLPLHIQVQRSIAQKVPYSISHHIPEVARKILIIEHAKVSTDFQYGFWNEFQSHFGVDEKITGIEDIWGLFSIYMDQHTTSEVDRIKANLHFVTNLSIPSLLGLYFAIAFSFTKPSTGAVTITLGVLFVFFILYFVFPLLSFAESKYVEKMLITYYIDREVKET